MPGDPTPDHPDDDRVPCERVEAADARAIDVARVWWASGPDAHGQLGPRRVFPRVDRGVR